MHMLLSNHAVEQLLSNQFLLYSSSSYSPLIGIPAQQGCPAAQQQSTATTHTHAHAAARDAVLRLHAAGTANCENIALSH
jgi:hypothetical protein